MKYIPLFLLIAFANVAQAINLTFDFTERDRMGVTGGTHQYLFDELNGTEFLGQKISLDINFSGEQFIRIFSITSQRLELHFDLYTNNYPIPYTESGFRDLVDNVSGYVTGKEWQGNQESRSSRRGLLGWHRNLPNPRSGKWWPL